MEFREEASKLVLHAAVERALTHADPAEDTALVLPMPITREQEAAWAKIVAYGRTLIRAGATPEQVANFIMNATFTVTFSFFFYF